MRATSPSDTLDTVDTLAASPWPEPQSVKSVQSVRGDRTVLTATAGRRPCRLRHHRADHHERSCGGGLDDVQPDAKRNEARAEARQARDEAAGESANQDDQRRCIQHCDRSDGDGSENRLMSHGGHGCGRRHPRMAGVAYAAVSMPPQRAGTVQHKPSFDFPWMSLPSPRV